MAFSCDLQFKPYIKKDNISIIEIINCIMCLCQYHSLQNMHM